MNPDDVLNKLLKMGLKTSRSTLLRYEKAGLVPEPDRGSVGRGVGRFSDYPEDTASYFFAAYHVLRSTNLEIKDLAQLLPKIGRYSFETTKCQELLDKCESIDSGGAAGAKCRRFFEQCTTVPEDQRERAAEIFLLWYGYFDTSKKTQSELIETIEHTEAMHKEYENMYMDAIKRLRAENDRLYNEISILKEKLAAIKSAVE